MKRFIALFLIFVLSLTFIAGCETAEDVSSEIISESIESEESKVVVKNLRIGTYNIANGRDVNWDFKQIADDIIENDLDIVGLQEVDQLCNRSKRSDTIKILSVSTGMKYYAFFKCINYDGGEYGTAILSKYPIIETEEIELNNGAKVERRLLTLAKIDVDGTVFNFFNTHLTVASDEIRADEFKLVAEAVKDKPNCILTGDFNVDSYEEFEILKPLSYVNNPDNQYVTFPKGSLKIDNICFSSELELVEGKHGIFQKNHSDHVLLFAELQYVAEQ